MIRLFAVEMTENTYSPFIERGDTVIFEQIDGNLPRPIEIRRGIGQEITRPIFKNGFEVPEIDKLDFELDFELDFDFSKAEADFSKCRIIVN